MVRTAASGLSQMSRYCGSEGGAAPDFEGVREMASMEGVVWDGRLWKLVPGISRMGLFGLMGF
jgi:hypothetical protein